MSKLGRIRHIAPKPTSLSSLRPGFPVILAFPRHLTALPIIPVYILCNAVDAVKCAVGVVMIRKGNWVQNLAIK